MTTATPVPTGLTPSQGEALVTLARQTLMKRLDRPIAADQIRRLEDRLKDGALQMASGTFVTLKIDDRLRGCIGCLTGTEPLVDGVRSNAANAAFHDPRFDPLTEEELDTVSIEVSVLTEPQPLLYADAHDLTAKLRPGVDGVTIRIGSASATFLPQVWAQLPTPESFLSNLCLKAGLAGDDWRREQMVVETYQVQSFEESK